MSNASVGNLGNTAANIALLTDPEEMRAVSRAVSSLSEDFDAIRNGLKASIENTLNSECAGEVANEFTRYFNENINTKLVEEKERLDGVAGTLAAAADNFGNTAASVMASFK